MDERLGLSRILSGTPPLVGAINVVVVGVLAALIAETLGAPGEVYVVVGVAAALAAAVVLGAMTFRSIASVRRAHRPRFPS